MYKISNCSFISNSQEESRNRKELHYSIVSKWFITILIII